MGIISMPVCIHTICFKEWGRECAMHFRPRCVWCGLFTRFVWWIMRGRLMAFGWIACGRLMSFGQIACERLTSFGWIACKWLFGLCGIAWKNMM